MLRGRSAAPPPENLVLTLDILNNVVGTYDDPSGSFAHVAWDRLQLDQDGNAVGLWISCCLPVAPAVETFTDEFLTNGAGENEPTGFVAGWDRQWLLIGDHDLGIQDAGFDDIEDPRYALGGTSTLRRATSADYPRYPEYYGEIVYPNAAAGGGSFGLAQIHSFAALTYGQIYHRYLLWISPEFEGHPPSTTNKISFYWTGAGGVGGQFFPRLVGAGDAALYYEVGIQGPAPTRLGRSRLLPNVAPYEIRRGRWYWVEERFKCNRVGLAEGEAQVWIGEYPDPRGDLIINYNDIEITEGVTVANPVAEEPYFYQWQWSPTWGGGGGITTREFSMRIGRSYGSLAP